MGATIRENAPNATTAAFSLLTRFRRMRSRKFNAESGAEQQDVHARVTSKIVEMLENGVRPWAQPWQAGKLGTRPLRHNGVP